MNLTVLPITFLHYLEESQEGFYQEVCSVETTNINVGDPPKQHILEELKITVEGLTMDQIEELW